MPVSTHCSLANKSSFANNLGSIFKPCHLIIMPAISWHAPHGAIDYSLSVLTPLWMVDMISNEALQQCMER